MTTPQEPTPGSDAPGDPISMYLQQVRAQQRHAAALGSVPAMLTAVADNALRPTKTDLDKGVAAFRASWQDDVGDAYSDRLSQSANKVGATVNELANGGRGLAAPFAALRDLVNNKVLELEELRAQYQRAKSMSVVVAPAPEYEAAKIAADAMAAQAEAAVEKARQIAEEVSNGFQQAAQQLNSAVDRIPAWDGATQGVGGAPAGGSGPAAPSANSAPAATGAPAAGGAGGPEAAGTSGANTPGGASTAGGADAGGGAGAASAQGTASAPGGAGAGGAGGGASISPAAGEPALSGLATGAPPPTVPPLTGVGGVPAPGPAPAAPLLPPITAGGVPSTASRGVVGATGGPRPPTAVGGGTVSISGSVVGGSTVGGSVSGPAALPTAAKPTGAILPSSPPPPPAMPSAATPPGAAGASGGGAPMMPPMAGAGGLGATRPGGGGGGRDYDGGSHRSRPQRTVPGVPPKLRGAAGKVEAPQTFLPQSTLRRQDDEEEPTTVRLLDEEVWQVESPGGNPSGARGTATS